MGSLSPSYNNCMRIVKMLDAQFFPSSSIPSCNQSLLHKDDIDLLSEYCVTIHKSEEEGKYSEPMLWIGIYIAVASLFCILAMVADLVHGFRSRKLWFPSKYFTLNTASITVITIAMKLPVDLNNPMRGWVDQCAKLGSLTFMCTMMANLMPSLASMNNKELFANVIGLVILVITMFVNVIIQLKTGVIQIHVGPYIIVVGTILYLLIILTSSALTTPASKQILEFKYQAAHKTASRDEHPQHRRLPTVEELAQHVRRYWVMAGTCNPQFVMATTPLCSAIGIICIPSVLLHFVMVVTISFDRTSKDYNSDYKWSMLLIFIVQSVGVAVGTIAPIFRCFAPLSFKLSIKWSKNHIKVFKVEEFWTQKLSEWKQSHLAFPLKGRKSKILIKNLKNLILSICIGSQKVIVISCKIITLIPIGIVIFFVYCLHYWKSLKAMFFAMPIASRRDTIHEHEQKDTNDDVSNYALLLQDEMEIGMRILKRISNSADLLIRKAEKQPPKNLLKLLEKSTTFEGVVNFDNDQFEALPSIKLPNNWSLPIVTLTSIATTLPHISDEKVNGLFTSVDEGLFYTHIVDESLNNNSESINIQKAVKTVWDEVEVNRRWLGNTLPRNAYKGKLPIEILEWFADTAKEIVQEFNQSSNEEPLDNSFKLIAANSMYRIAKTIRLIHQNNMDQIREEELFDLLSCMIADIMAACLTNLPRVIAMKCHESVIEKREASVQATAKLLGRTKGIIKKIQERELPSLDLDEMAFIDEWRVHLKQSIP